MNGGGGFAARRAASAARCFSASADSFSWASPLATVAASTFTPSAARAVSARASPGELPTTTAAITPSRPMMN